MPPNRTEDGRLLPPLPTAPPRSSSTEVARASFRARLLGSFPISDVLHWGFRKKPEHNAETNSPSCRRIPERSKRRKDSSSSSSSSSEDEDDGGEAAVEITLDQYKIAVSSIVQEVSPTEPAAKKVRKDESPPAATPSSDDSGEARNGPSPPPASSSRPWNLRKRRSICGLPSAQQQRSKLQSPQEAAPAAAVKNQLTAPRSVKDCVSEKKERTTLYPSLSKGEIYEDFLLMTGAPPPRRHKKRPAKVQRFIENMYPELSTPWITADLYKVPEEKGKKR